jgi:hypothetical protein
MFGCSNVEQLWTTNCSKGLKNDSQLEQMKVQVDQQKNQFVQAEVNKCHNKIPSNLVKISY